MCAVAGIPFVFFFVIASSAPVLSRPFWMKRKSGTGVSAGVRRCAAESFPPAETPVSPNLFFLAEGEAIQGVLDRRVA
jgi:hypothetical protein